MRGDEGAQNTLHTLGKQECVRRRRSTNTQVLVHPTQPNSGAERTGAAPTTLGGRQRGRPKAGQEARAAERNEPNAQRPHTETAPRPREERSRRRRGGHTPPAGQRPTGAEGRGDRGEGTGAPRKHHDNTTRADGRKATARRRPAGTNQKRRRRRRGLDGRDAGRPRAGEERART